MNMDCCTHHRDAWGGFFLQFSFLFFFIASVKIRRNSTVVRIWEFQMSQIHFSLIFLKGENRRQKRKEHLPGAEVGKHFP